MMPANVFGPWTGGATRVRRSSQRGGGLLDAPGSAFTHERDALHGVPHAQQALERAQGGLPRMWEPPHKSGRPQRLHFGGAVICESDGLTIVFSTCLGEEEEEEGKILQNR